MPNFAVMVISHGRPSNIYTVASLKKSGYSGNIYIIIDDEDKSRGEYFNNYGNKVIVFNKKYYVDNSISFNIKPLYNVAVHARNACEDIAKDLGLKYFLVLDDDIINFQFRYVENNILKRAKIDNMDDIINMYIEYMDSADISTIGFAHDGYFLGGNINIFTNPSHNRNRLLANSFLRKTDKAVKWGPDMCEDFISSILENRKGNLWMSLPFISCSCKPQGMNKKTIDGGNSTMYIENGNYGVSIYSVLNLPDCYRLKYGKKLWFECISYDLTVPKILSDKYKK